MAARTERQAEVLRFIQDFSVRRGAIPSYAQVARFIGVKSRATVAKHIMALEKQGLVKRQWNGDTFTLEVKPPKLIQCPTCNTTISLGATQHDY